MKGEFIRWDSSFRHWVTPDGSPGPSGEGGFTAEPGRYHLYVSYACPWAHRTLIVRVLKGLDDLISVSVVHPLMPAESWVFGEYPGATPDDVNGTRALNEVYALAAPGYDGIVTVPVLWDKRRRTIVNNESSEIIRMLNSAFDAWGRSDVDLYPDHLRAEIRAINELVYENVNNGVYRAGFAQTQEAYEAAFQELFAALDQLEVRLSRQRYLVGARVTEADWRLFTTLVRFDAVYYGHFKCNQRRLIDYPNLWGYTRELYQVPGVRQTVRMDHIKTHYYGSHKTLNRSASCPGGRRSIFSLPIIERAFRSFERYTSMWDQRYSSEEYAYGTEPNHFLVAMVDRLRKGSVLCLGEGEGRNGVWLAEQGFDVTGVDGSRVGLQKAQRLAAERGVAIHTLHVDLADYDIEPGAWDSVVSIFCHLPPGLRRKVHAQVVAGLKPGGVLLLEAYTPAQLALGTGGPPTETLMMDLESLRRELTELELVHAIELQRDVHEGAYHGGRGAVVQILGVRRMRDV